MVNKILLVSGSTKEKFNNIPAFIFIYSSHERLIDYFVHFYAVGKWQKKTTKAYSKDLCAMICFKSLHESENP